ncbi:MAG: YqjF family protein [Halarchaeum sp.]
MRVISMDWRDVCVASYAVDPGVVADTLPDGLAVDTFDGDAYLSVVPFVMADVRPYRFPRAVAPTFGELNLRTYVTGAGGPGVYFYNLDATDRLGVRLARATYRLPYYDASQRIVRRGDRIEFESERTHRGVPPCSFDATYAPTRSPTPADAGSLTAFLLERYRFYVEGSGTLLRGEVEHDPWRACEATLDVGENDLFAVNGFREPSGDPHVVYSPGVEVTAHSPVRD